MGFSVSNLRIPGFLRPWEAEDYGRPGTSRARSRSCSTGRSERPAFNNEFGRPGILGYFRTFEQSRAGTERGRSARAITSRSCWRAGSATCGPSLVHKAKLRAGCPLVVMGGPALLIGLGGGAASSKDQGSNQAQLDFASVQRDNPEMQRRCQEVIDQCVALGAESPIVSIHDVGAGGLANALPELVHDQDLGARIELREVPSAEPGLSPLEIWCNEAQERFVLGIDPERYDAVCHASPSASAARSLASVSPLTSRASSLTRSAFGRHPHRSAARCAVRQHAAAPA